MSKELEYAARRTPKEFRSAAQGFPTKSGYPGSANHQTHEP